MMKNLIKTYCQPCIYYHQPTGECSLLNGNTLRVIFEKGICKPGEMVRKIVKRVLYDALRGRITLEFDMIVTRETIQADLASVTFEMITLLQAHQLTKRFTIFALKSYFNTFIRDKLIHRRRCRECLYLIPSQEHYTCQKQTLITACFLLTEDSFRRMKAAGIPDEVVNALRILKDREEINRKRLLQKIFTLLGEEQFKKYQAVIEKCIESTDEHEVNNPYYEQKRNPTNHACKGLDPLPLIVMPTCHVSDSEVIVMFNILAQRAAKANKRQQPKCRRQYVVFSLLVQWCETGHGTWEDWKLETATLFKVSIRAIERDLDEIIEFFQEFGVI